MSSYQGHTKPNKTKQNPFTTRIPPNTRNAYRDLYKYKNIYYCMSITFIILPLAVVYNMYVYVCMNVCLCMYDNIVINKDPHLKLSNVKNFYSSKSEEERERGREREKWRNKRSSTFTFIFTVERHFGKRCQIVIYMDFCSIPEELNWNPQQSYR